MELTQEQSKAIKELYEAMIESLSWTPGLGERVRKLRACGLQFSAFKLDMFVEPIPDQAVSTQSDADWLKSLRIAPDLEVRDGSQ